MTDITPAVTTASGLLTLHDLIFLSEGDQTIIGRPEVDSFAVFSADAAGLVRRLQLGDDLATAGAWYQSVYGTRADLGDLVDMLRELQFVRPAGEAPPRRAGQPPIRWQRLGRVAFSPMALALYAALAGAAGYLMVTVPALRPVPSAVFFSRSVLVVLGVTLAGQAVGVAWHEAFHVLAGRRLGLPSTLSFGRRLYFVVIQTTLTGLMGVPARKRILPFCAGLIADAVAVSLLTGLAAAGHAAGWPPWAGRTAVGLAYLTLLRMAWQAMVFMETDLCHVLASVLRCPDLHAMTRQYLRVSYARLRCRCTKLGSRCTKLGSRCTKLGGRVPAGGATGEHARYAAGWSAREVRIVRRYAPWVAAGSAALIGSMVISTIPVLAGLAARMYHAIASGDLASSRFWDSAIAGGLMVAQFAAVAVLKIHDRRQPKQAGST